MPWILFYLPQIVSGEGQIPYDTGGRNLSHCQGILNKSFCCFVSDSEKVAQQDTPDKKVPSGCCARDLDIHMSCLVLRAGGQQLHPENCNALAGHQVWCGEGQTPFRSVRQSLCNCLEFGPKRLQTRFWLGLNFSEASVDLFNIDKPDTWLQVDCTPFVLAGAEICPH